MATHFRPSSFRGSRGRLDDFATDANVRNGNRLRNHSAAGYPFQLASAASAAALPSPPPQKRSAASAAASREKTGTPLWIYTALFLLILLFPLPSSALSPLAQAQKERMLCLREKHDAFGCGMTAVQNLERTINTLPSKTFHDRMVILDAKRGLAGMRLSILANLHESNGKSVAKSAQRLLETTKSMERALDAWIVPDENAGERHVRHAILLWDFLNERLSEFIAAEFARTNLPASP